jgi:hypothetical protein
VSGEEGRDPAVVVVPLLLMLVLVVMLAKMGNIAMII